MGMTYKMMDCSTCHFENQAFDGPNCNDCGRDCSNWQPKEDAEKPSALNVQVAGDHYKNGTIQPVEYIHANGLNFFEGSAVKYITRWRDKGGRADLEKAKHLLDIMMELDGV